MAAILFLVLILEVPYSGDAGKMYLAIYSFSWNHMYWWHYYNSVGLVLNGNALANLIECVTPPQSPPSVSVGEWVYPDGAVIQEGVRPPVYAVYRRTARLAELHVMGGLVEGNYTCRIKDSASNNIHSQYYIRLHNTASDNGW